MKTDINRILASALLTVLAGCSGSLETESADEARRLTFGVEVCGTRAELKTSFSSGDQFRVWATDNKGQIIDGSEENQWVTMQSDGSWTCPISPLWKKNMKMSFCAYYPTDLSIAGLGMTTPENGFTISGYTLTQKDALLGHYSGFGDNGKATIRFQHILAGAKFFLKTAAPASIAEITSVALANEYTGGSCELHNVSGDSAIEWTARTGSAGIQQALSGQSKNQGAVIGTPFLVIPRTGGNISLNLTVKFTDNTTTTLSATVSGVTLSPGVVSVFNVTIPDKMDIGSLTVESWTEDDPIDEQIKNKKD